MVKKKTYLRRHIRCKTNRPNPPANIKKRKFVKTPRKPSPCKGFKSSLYKSPAFRSHYKSPATKRFKRLFTPLDSPLKTTNPTFERTLETDKDNVTETTTDTVSLSEDFGFSVLSEEVENDDIEFEESQPPEENADLEYRLQQMIPGILQ